MKKTYQDIINDDKDIQERVVGECPECSYPVVDEMGVVVCYHCGWSNDPSI